MQYKFKQTEIGMIPQDWEKVRLGDKVSLEYGKGLTEAQRENGRYPVFGSNGVVGYHNDFLIKGPGIIVGRKGTIGAISWSNNNFWPIDTTYFVKLIDDKVDLRWLYFKLTALNLSKLNMATGTPGLNRDLAYSQVIPLPPLLEQKKIAEILSTADEAIEKVDEAIEKTQRLKKGLMQELLTKGIGHKEFKETAIGRIPKKWEINSITEVGTLQYGITKTAKKVNTGIKFLRITDITDEGIKWNSVPYCELTKNELEKYELKNGDILFARIGATTGKTCFIEKAPKSVFGSYLLRMQPLKDIDTKLLYFFTQSPSYWNQVNAVKGGQLKGGLNTKLLGSIKLPTPPLFEQQKIAEILNSVDKRLELLRMRKEKLERAKKGLMDGLLTGKVRVTRLITEEDFHEKA